MQGSQAERDRQREGDDGGWEKRAAGRLLCFQNSELADGWSSSRGCRRMATLFLFLVRTLGSLAEMELCEEQQRYQ